MNGFITLDKKIIEWEWYKCTNERTIFIHLLVTCNYETKTWRGVKIKRGQIVTSYKSLSNQTGLSISSVRRAINNLKKTGELTSKATNQFSLITICKYDDYQNKSKSPDKPNNKPNSKQQNTQQSTQLDIQLNNNINNINNINKKKKGQPTKAPSEKAAFVYPTYNEVRAYFYEANLLHSNPLNFFNEYENKLTVNWKQDALNYAKNGK